MSDVRAAPSSSSAQEMVLEDVDPSSFGLGFGQDDAPGAPIRTGGTQRLTTVDAPIDDGLDDDDDDIDIDLD
jgi:hypothetical protein